MRNGQAGVGISIFWFVCQPELGFAEEDPGPSSVGGAGQDAGWFLQVGSYDLEECSNLFTGGHSTDSVSTGNDGEAGPDGQDIWRG